MSRIRWWQVWRYGELKRQNEAELSRLVGDGTITAEQAKLLVRSCRLGCRITPELWESAGPPLTRERGDSSA